MKREILQLLEAYEKDILNELEETNSVSQLMILTSKLIAVIEIREAVQTYAES